MFEIKTNAMGQEILRLKHVRPFAPFEIKTDDGKRRRVKYEMQATVVPNGEWVAMYNGAEGRIDFPVSSVVAVEPVKPRRRALRKRSN